MAWEKESKRHSDVQKKVSRFSGAVVSTPAPSLSSPFAPDGAKEFKLTPTVSVMCWYEKTRNAFRHVAVVYKWNGSNWQEDFRTKIPYQNRTWESYTYQSVLFKAIEGQTCLTDAEKIKAMEYAKTGLEQEEHARVDREFGTIRAVAQMGEFLGSTKKEKNDWKTRMLKAGLENKGLIMPEDWDSLDEDEKEKRLNKVLQMMGK